VDPQSVNACSCARDKSARGQAHYWNLFNAVKLRELTRFAAALRPAILFDRPAFGGKVAHEGRGAADRGEYRKLPELLRRR
jgi:hypothetical protein